MIAGKKIDIIFIIQMAMDAAKIKEGMLCNWQLRNECMNWITRRRQMDLNQFTDSSRQRFFNWSEDGGGELLEYLFEDKNHLTVKMAGKKRWGFRFSDGYNLNVSMRQARANGVFSFDKEVPFLPMVDWLAAHAVQNGKKSWPSLSEEKLSRVREHRMIEESALLTAAMNTTECMLGHITMREAKKIIEVIDRGCRGDKELLPSCAVSLDNEKIMIPEQDFVALRTRSQYSAVESI